MADELKFPLPCSVPGCTDTCATLVIKDDDAEWRWHAEHGRRTHPNSMDVVKLLRLLASQKPGLLRKILEQAA